MQARRATILALPASELVELWGRLCRLDAHSDQEPDHGPFGDRTP